MIDDIIEDCMGSGLYNSLVNTFGNNRINIIFNDESCDSSYNRYYNKMTIGKDITDDCLFHEMFHAYQSAKNLDNDSYYNSTLNMDIEAHYVQYKYLCSKQEQNKWGAGSNEPRFYAIAKLDEFITDDITMRDNLTEIDIDNYLYIVANAFRYNNVYGDTSVYLYNDSIIGLQNFKSLKEIVKNCS